MPLCSDRIIYILLLQRLHEENEKLFDRLTEKASLLGSAQVDFLSQNGIIAHLYPEKGNFCPEKLLKLIGHFVLFLVYFLPDALSSLLGNEFFVTILLSF